MPKLGDLPALGAVNERHTFHQINAGLHRIAAIKSTDAPVFPLILCGYQYFK